MPKTANVPKKLVLKMKVPVKTNLISANTLYYYIYVHKLKKKSKGTHCINIHIYV